jgi:hypothetical protein
MSARARALCAPQRRRWAVLNDIAVVRAACPFLQVWCVRVGARQVRKGVGQAWRQSLALRTRRSGRWIRASV